MQPEQNDALHYVKVPKGFLLALWMVAWTALSTVGWTECAMTKDFGNSSLWPAPALFGALAVLLGFIWSLYDGRCS